MSVGIILIAALGVALFIFKDDIANTLSGGIFGLGKGLEDLAKGGGEALDVFKKDVETAVKPISDAGVNLGNSFTQLTSQLGIGAAEEKLEVEALKAGFASKAAQELATDSGSVVIGSKNNVVNFGLIGNILPTDPSPEFIANASTLLTPTQLIEFNKQQGSGMFGGQSPKQVSVSDPFAEITKSINDAGKSFTDFFGGLF